MTDSRRNRHAALAAALTLAALASSGWTGWSESSGADRGRTGVAAEGVRVPAAEAATAADRRPRRADRQPEAAPGTRPDTATVVLLHGLGRSERSMARMARSLDAAGYRAVNLGYRSRSHTVATLVDSLSAALDRCCADAERLHFVTHSLGGILVRAWAHAKGPGRLGRVVMLSPPNQGTGVVDRLPPGLVELVAGPASVQLGTDSGSVPVSLPPADFELGIITGDATINPLFSWWLPGEDDGMVAVDAAWVEGADDFLVVPYTHTFIMRRDRVIAQVLAFLETGRFLGESGS